MLNLVNLGIIVYLQGNLVGRHIWRHHWGGIGSHLRTIYVDTLQDSKIRPSDQLSLNRPINHTIFYLEDIYSVK